MSVPHGAYTAQPSMDIPINSYVTKKKGLLDIIQDFGTNAIGKTKEGLTDLFILGSVFLIAVIIGGGAVGYFGWRWMDTIVKEKEMAYERRMQTVSFNNFTNELAKIDPEEKKDFVTSKTICSDASIKGNPEADMMTVCLNDYYWRKKKTKSQIAQAGQ